MLTIHPNQSKFTKTTTTTTNLCFVHCKWLCTAVDTWWLGWKKPDKTATVC